MYRKCFQQVQIKFRLSRNKISQTHAWKPGIYHGEIFYLNKRRLSRHKVTCFFDFYLFIYFVFSELLQRKKLRPIRVGPKSPI